MGSPNHLSATRIIRSRFLPSSLGLVLAGCAGKKMRQAALSLRTKSLMGAAADESLPAAGEEAAPGLSCGHMRAHSPCQESMLWIAQHLHRYC